MGQDKLRMPLADGRRLIDAAADALRAHCDHLACVGPNPEGLPPLPGFVALQDYHDGDVPLQSGPMAGLVAALVYAREVDAKWVLAMAGDLPRVDAAQLSGLVAQAMTQIAAEEPSQGAGALQPLSPKAVVPVSENGPEPLLAAYPATFMEPALAYLKQGRRSLRGFLTQQPWIALSSTGLDTIPDCTNLNRPEDWERLPGPADQDSET